MEEQTAEVTVLIEEASAEYLGRWNRLVSTTNWEKGRIIQQWRERLIAAGAPQASYADEAWSRQVGNVTPQHVGRLRRTFERFGNAVDQYAGLYWSHFQAVLDWHDAEMWLEGAVQNDWSVAQMRQQRWQVQGAVEGQQPRDEEIVSAEVDEDSDSESTSDLPTSEPMAATTAEIHAPDIAEHERESESHAAEADNEAVAMDEPAAQPVAPAEKTRPFENMPELPADLGEAFDRFKLAILNHKVAGWQEISCQQVVDVLERLKQLALTPSEAPF